MSNTLQLNNPNHQPNFELSGKVKAFSGAGVSAQCETTGEDIKAQIDAVTLASLQRGLRFRTVIGGHSVRPGGR